MEDDDDDNDKSDSYPQENLPQPLFRHHRTIHNDNDNDDEEDFPQQLIRSPRTIHNDNDNDDDEEDFPQKLFRPPGTINNDNDNDDDNEYYPSQENLHRSLFTTERHNEVSFSEQLREDEPDQGFQSQRSLSYDEESDEEDDEGIIEPTQF